MHRRRRLNTRGKIAVSILLFILILLITWLFGGDKKGAAKESENIIGNSLDMLSFSSEPVEAFADSTLSQSIVEKENEKKEVSRQKEYKKQNQLDQLDKAIYLTFDDGPSRDTNQLLDILDDYDMTATFFMMGPKMKENPTVVKRTYHKGHGLALHGITHEVSNIYSSPYAPSEEMVEGQEILESITGVKSNIVRLPYGTFPYLTESMRYVLSQNEFNTWDWNVDSMDWDLKDDRYVQHTIQELKRTEEVGETPIVLLHDKKETIEYLPELLSYIKKQGYKAKVLTNDMTPLTFPCAGQCRQIN
ncbi:polysaccharide deacetylase family protein [Oceanobacillus chungangensis]|uniref:Polysaccharide deacetylase n=1 Tax=Oceanobacillus chungangensis TaxID=1229152 RepID=A0A3D8PQ79_9BACI|nr:polysaccharide deacetylase family protein [Oceanobacillus chungangensis]RDW17707.1 polysaccharide deacetylase [Oceanobacillus chungangensis]